MNFELVPRKLLPLKIATHNKILVIRGGAIGDFILTLPVLAALRRQFPQTHLEVLGYPHIAQLAVAGGLADAVRSIEARPLAGFFARRGNLAEEWREYFAGFAVIISYLYDPDGFFQANVTAGTKAQFLAGPHRPDDTAGRHATEVFLQPLERLAIFDADPVPRLALVPLTAGAPSAHESERRFPNRRESRSRRSEPIWKSALRPIPGTPPAVLPVNPLLVVHPGSGSPRKNWPVEHWAALLADYLRAPDARLLLVGGEADGPALAHLQRVLPAARVELAIGLPLAALAARLAMNRSADFQSGGSPDAIEARRFGNWRSEVPGFQAPDLVRGILPACHAFVGHDSGITHLAAAVGLPGLALWGETVEAVWHPRGARIKVLRAEGSLAALPVARVREELHRLLAPA